MSKPWWQSVTLWIQILSLASFGLVLVLDQAAVLELSPRVVAALGILSAVVTGLRRVLAQHQAIEGSPASWDKR